VLRAASFAFFLVISLASSPTRAAPRPRGVGVRLTYERGAGARQCPDATKLRSEVAAEIGHDPFTEAGPWRLLVTVARGKTGGFVATADLLDNEGAISVSMGDMVSPDCRSLVVKATAVWIAWYLTDPPLAAPAPLATPSLPPPPSTTPSLPPPPTEVPPAYRLRLGAATGIELGLGPTPTPLFSLNLALQFPTAPILSLAFEARTDLPLSATGEGGANVHAIALTGSLLTCFHAFNEGMLYGCPMFSAGLISSGERYATRDARGVYSAAGARVGAAIPFASHRFAFTFTGDVLGTLHPFRLFFDKRLAWQTGPLSGAIQAGFFAFL
jgi:hypothetical protein